MALLLSVVVTAVGAFLLWGVDRSIGGVNANTIGAILVVLGAIGALMSLVLRSRSSRYVDRDYDDDDERLTTRPR
jgi:hypothetical protein